MFGDESPVASTSRFVWHEQPAEVVKRESCGPTCTFEPAASTSACTAECHTDCGQDCDWMHPVKSCGQCSDDIGQSLRDMLSPEIDEKALQEILDCCCCETSLNAITGPAAGVLLYRCEWADCTSQHATHEELTAHVLKAHLKIDQHSTLLEAQLKDLEESLKAATAATTPTVRQTSLGPPPSTQTLLLEHAAHSMLPPHDPTDHPLLPHTHVVTANGATHIHHHHHHHHVAPPPSHAQPLAAESSSDCPTSSSTGTRRSSNLVQRTAASTTRKPAQSSPYGPYAARASTSGSTTTTTTTTSTPPALTIFGEEVGPSPVAEGAHRCYWEGCPFNPDTAIDQVGWLTTADLMDHIGVFHIGRGKKTYTCRWGDCCASKCTRGKGKDENASHDLSERKVFAQRQKVMRHIQMHTGDKPFVCQICSKAFSEAKTLEQVRSLPFSPVRPAEQMRQHVKSHEQEERQAELATSTVEPVVA